MDFLINQIILFVLVFVATVVLVVTFHQRMNELQSKMREIDKKLDDIKAGLSAR